MANETIRTAARKKRVRLWEIADYLEVSDNTLFRRMRHELTPEEQQKILMIIDELSKNND